MFGGGSMAGNREGPARKSSGEFYRAQRFREVFLAWCRKVPLLNPPSVVTSLRIEEQRKPNTKRSIEEIVFFKPIIREACSKQESSYLEIGSQQFRRPVCYKVALCKTVSDFMHYSGRSPSFRVSDLV